MADTLASISEYGEESRPSSISGFTTSTYIGYTRSPSGESLNTLSSGVRTYNNGLPGERKNEMLSKRFRKKSLSKKGNYELCKKIRVTVALIGILLLVAAIFMLSFYLPKQYESYDDSKTVIQPSNKRFIWDDNIEIKENMSIFFSTNLTEPVLESELGPDIALSGYFGELLTPESRRNYSKIITNDSMTMTFKGEDQHTKLVISKVGFHNQCYEIYWTSRYDKRLQDCFDTESSHWFGLGEIFNQVWPVDRLSFSMTPFVTSDYLEPTADTIFGGVLEPLMINSKGAGIYVSETVRLSVGMNEHDMKKFCIRAEKRSCDVDENTKNELNYTICIANNIREVHRILFNQYIEKPIGYPEERMLTEPIWSTWAIYKDEVNQSVVLKFAEDIKKYKFEASHIIIEGKYSSEYGNFNFDPQKFGDYSYMINRLRSDNFRTTVFIPTFASLKSKIFLSGFDYWLKVGSPKKLVPGIVKWWLGYGGVLDVTNEDSRNWFVKRLQEFQKLKLDGFKFDSGEVKSLPLNHVFATPQPNPNYYTKLYVELASQFPLSEVRVGYKSQQYPIFVRLLDRRSDWDSQNGLRSVLSAVLTFSILGYPFIIPDMVGGNYYLNNKPNKELYIRWAQLCAFLPAIQFSLPPWQFNDEVVDIVHNALLIRKNLSNYMIELAKNVQITGEPIIRPLWWYWPNDQETFVIDTEFMLGADYLIAPVLNMNVIKHAVYLPAGVWEELWGDRMILNVTEGNFRHYHVSLHNICYFRLIRILPE